MPTVRPLRARLLAGAAVLGCSTGLVTSFDARAQVAQPAAPVEAATGGEEPEGALEEIVITAQRREENLQDVPIAVSAVSSEALDRAGVEDTTSISQIVPSVQVTRSGPSGLFFIRGVGSTNAATGDEGSNAVYLDNVYIGDLIQTLVNFNNIERVEVLKGPQGTLFGRNSTGGLIHIITKDPGDRFEVRGQVGAGNYDTITGQLYVAGPLAEGVSADIALTGLDQDEGWGRNLTLNRDSKLREFWGARSKVVLRPSGGVKITLAGDYSHSDDSTALDWKLKEGFLGTGGFAGPPGQDTTVNTPGQSRSNSWGLSLTGSVDLGFATLTSISAVRKVKTRSLFDSDGGPVNRVNVRPHSSGRTIQQELRLASDSHGPLVWQAGLFYLNSKAASQLLTSGLSFAALGRASTLNDGVLDTKSYAVFGEGTYSLGEKTHLTGGLRYTIERRDLTGVQSATLLNGTTQTLAVIDTGLKYKEVTYRASLRHEFTDDLNVYASINRGFKAGTFTLSDITLPPVKPQFIMAYEVGLKSQLLNRRLRLNLAAYHYDIDDYQVRTGSILGTNTVVFLNAATVKVNGFDLEFEAAPTDELRIFGGFTILDSTFGKFGGPPVATTPQSPILYPNPASCPAALRGTTDPGVLGPGPRTGGFTTCFGDVSGNRTPMAPKFAASLGSTYIVPVGQRGELRLSALYNYNSGYVFEPSGLIRQGKFSLINASAEYRPNEKIGVEFWVKNLTDTEYEVSNLAGGSGSTTTLGPPRTYGVNVKFDF